MDDAATLTATHRLALGACALLATLHLLLRLANADWLANGVFLVPGYTVTRPWQVVTANLFEDSSPNLVAALVCVCAASALLLPRWGEAELARFLLLTSTLQACVSWACMVGLYILFRSEHFLFAQLGGLTGLLGSLSVAFAQVSSDGPGPHKALALALALTLPLTLAITLPLTLAITTTLTIAITTTLTIALPLAASLSARRRRSRAAACRRRDAPRSARGARVVGGAAAAHSRRESAVGCRRLP